MQIFIGDIGAIVRRPIMAELIRQAGVLIYRPSYSASFFRKAHIIAVRRERLPS